jgi:hypothetical protein
LKFLLVRCALAGTGTTQMLWSHYGDKHKGICIGLEIGAEVDIKELRYVSDWQAVDVSPLMEAAARRETLQVSESAFQAAQETRHSNAGHEGEGMAL